MLMNQVVTSRDFRSETRKIVSRRIGILNLVIELLVIELFRN
jgi:hypothetical protein